MCPKAFTRLPRIRPDILVLSKILPPEVRFFVEKSLPGSGHMLQRHRRSQSQCMHDVAGQTGAVQSIEMQVLDPLLGQIRAQVRRLNRGEQVKPVVPLGSLEPLGDMVRDGRAAPGREVPGRMPVFDRQDARTWCSALPGKAR